jgi:hypothetical protein
MTKTNPIEPIEVNSFGIKEMHEILINRSHSIDPIYFQWIRRKLVAIFAKSVRIAVTHQDLARAGGLAGPKEGW